MNRTRTSRRFRRILEPVFLMMLAVFLTGGSLALRTQEELAEKVVRLHVLAASDAPEDQARKLAVRDAVLARASEALEGVRGRADAEARLRSVLPELEKTAASALAAAGGTDTVRAELRETEFPTRTYDGFSLPAGRYLALRIVIGGGRGRNWWCVVFPPLCGTGGAVSVTDAPSGFTAEELRLITEEDAGYVLKFRTVELWQKLRQALS